jgi:peptidoglycan/xylan/chitin deacetylase (PgdA/CDA1 family)
MTSKLVPIILLPLAMGGGCLWWLPSDSDGEPTNTPRVLIQITEYTNRTAFDRIVAELRARNAKAAILVTGDFASENCDALTELHSQGYEIMAFLRPESPTGEKLKLSQLPRVEQERLITETKTALETCLGTAPVGFRATNFDQNQDTWEIVDTLGFEYNLAFVAGRSYLPGYESETLPYRSPEYHFWAVPMHAAEKDGRLSAFCDNPFESLPAAQWEALLKSEFDRMRDEGRPLLVEFHPYLSGVDEGRFQAFVSFLDYAVQQGAEFLTTAGYVEWSELANAVCDE